MESGLCMNSPNMEAGTTRTKYNYYGANFQENHSIHVAVHVRLFPSEENTWRQGIFSHKYKDISFFSSIFFSSKKKEVVNTRTSPV